MTQPLAVPKSQFQKFFGQKKNYWNKCVWWLMWINLKGIRTATPEIS
jgi:hypothetical protein